MTEEGKKGLQQFVLSDEEEEVDFFEPISDRNLVSKKLSTLTETAVRRSSNIDSQEPDPLGRDTPAALPNSDTFLKLTSYRSSDFQTKWATVVFLCNMYNLIAAPLYVGLTYQPAGFWLGLEAGTELILIIDMLARVVLSRTKIWQQMWMLHDSQSGHFYIFRLVVASLPYSIIISAVEQHDLSDIGEMCLSLIRLMKLLRAPQLLDFSMNVELISRSGSLSLIKALELVVVLLSLTHLGAVSFLIVNHLDSLYDTTTNWNHVGGNELLQYISGWFWVTCSMTGTGYGDVVPTTNPELFNTILIFLAGGLFYAAIFGQMVVVMHLLHQKNRESLSSMKKAMQWAKERKLGSAMVDRIHSYYSLVREHYQHVSNSEFLDQLPLSLRTEISMFLHEDLIQNVKIFEMGDPSFILAMVRHLMARIYTEGDFIIRRGDIAEELFFMQHGSAKVLATDESTVIAVMGEGSFFGEIGVLLQSKRSASVKALTSVLASAISKEHLVAILKNFPDQEAFLIRIGRQRQRTTRPEDLNLAIPISLGPEEYPINSAPIKVPRNLCSRVYRLLVPKWLWMALVTMGCIYNLVYVPMAIAFDFRFQGRAITWDAIVILVNVLEVIRQLRKEDLRKYMNERFMYDFVSCLPVDYAVYALHGSILETNIFMLLRLLKGISLVRRYHIRQIVWTHPKLKLLVYASILVTYYHFCTCIFNIIERLQQNYFPNTLPDGTTWSNHYDSQP